MTQAQLKVVVERLQIVFFQMMDGGNICGVTWPPAKIDSKVFKCRF